MLNTYLRQWLRVENAAQLLLWIIVYSRLGSGWLVFALSFLLPDLSMLGYLKNSRVGALSYNSVHSYVAPSILGLLSFLHIPYSLTAALIWAAHIAFDRTLGYGLKDPSSFNVTHLGRIGRKRESGHTKDQL